MDNFGPALSKIREANRGLFDPSALSIPSFDEPDRLIDIRDFDLQILSNAEQISEGNIVRETEDMNDNLWEELDRNVEQYDGDTNLSHGVELLAVYLSFHYYPENHWGVRFFEKNIDEFTSKLFRRSIGLYGRRYSWNDVFRQVMYGIFRHEFVHYMLDLWSLSLELASGAANTKVYTPYFSSVYQTVFPGQDCLEETVASYWKYTNSFGHARLRSLLKQAVSEIPANAYNAAADLGAEDIKDVEDRLAAQISQQIPIPIDPPPMWGFLPVPYHTPWTRYENLPLMMDNSGGGSLAASLKSGAIRKTIKIRHL